MFSYFSLTEFYLSNYLVFFLITLLALFLQCSFEPDDCKDKLEVKPDLSIGSTLECFFNPKDFHQVVRIKASKESYNKMLVRHVVWPLAIMMLGLVSIATATCCYFSQRRDTYEELTGVSSRTLLQTL